jgi:hypothetical protein
MNSIFTFDHGQKKLNKAIGVESAYMDDLQKQVSNILRNHLFDQNKDLNDDLSPSMLVEAALNEFSYSQLVIIASFYLNEKLEQFGDFVNILEKKQDEIKSNITRIAVDSDDIPENVRDFLENMSAGGSKDPINSESLPPEIKDFLYKIIKKNMREDEE